MTRPRTVPNEAILAAARLCAVEHGPSVSLDVIADRVGLTSPALLKRFGSRQLLMITALRPSDPPAWVQELERGPDDRPLIDQLTQLIDRVLDFFTSEMPCINVLAESGFPVENIFDKTQTPPPFRNIWAFASWLKRAQQRGLIDLHAIQASDFESVAAGLLGALHSRVFLNDFLGASYWRRTRAEYVADIAKIYARALAPAVTAPRSTARKTAPRIPKPLRTRKKS